MFFSAAGYALQYHHKKNMQLITFLVFMVLFWNCMPSNVILLPFFSYWFENANQYFVTNDNIFTLSLTEFRIPYQQFPSSWYLYPLLSYDVISSILLAGFFLWFHNALLNEIHPQKRNGNSFDNISNRVSAITFFPWHLKQLLCLLDWQVGQILQHSCVGLHWP